MNQIYWDITLTKDIRVSKKTKEVHAHSKHLQFTNSIMKLSELSLIEQ